LAPKGFKVHRVPKVLKALLGLQGSLELLVLRDHKAFKAHKELREQ
jgi:hypothetical protein